MHRYTYIYIDIHIYIDILTYTYIYIHMHAHAGRKQAAFRNTHTYTLHTVAISSHSFVAAQLGFAGIGRCCHGVVAQHCPCEVPREAGGIPCLRRWQISFLPQDPGSCQGSHQTCNQHCQKWAGEYSSAQAVIQGVREQVQGAGEYSSA